VTYDYDADGNLWKTSYPNNLVETRTYDDLGRLDLLKTAKVDPVTKLELDVISSYDYAVDNVGNRKEVLENSGRKVEYEYDDLNRLKSEKITNDPNGNNRVISYTYDAVGNRLTQTDSVTGVTTYTYNGLNQLDFLTTNGEVTDYSYDGNGSLISEVTGSNSTVYRWANDGENRLMGVTVNEGGVSRDVGYEYNAKGVRVGKVVDGVSTRYLIDELQPYAQVLEEYDALGNAKGSYVYGLDLLGRVSGMQPEFYHSDGLGSTRVLTNALGVVADSYSYDAFGNLIGGNGGSNNYLFAGEQRDSETGLDYLRARYYDPFVGRFISADAYEGILDDPLSLHDYLYADANPVVNTDPSGYFTLGEIQAAESIRNILAGIQIDSGSYLISATINYAQGKNYEIKDFLFDFGINLGIALVPSLIPFIAKLTKLKPFSRISAKMRSGAGSLGQVPPTGNPVFDILAIQTEAYLLWVKNLENRGIMVVEQTLAIGTHAEISRIPNSKKLMIELDPAQFTYLDLLHESRHFEQIRRFELKEEYTFKAAYRDYLEKGAYEYELRLADKYGFSEEYKDFAQQRINDYWGRSRKSKYNKSQSFRYELSLIWN